MWLGKLSRQSLRSSVDDFGGGAICLARNIVRTRGTRWWPLGGRGVGEVFLTRHFIPRAYGAGSIGVG